MIETGSQPPARGEGADRDRFYVQKDKHAIFQLWGKDDTQGSSPFETLKDAFIFAAAVDYSHGLRKALIGRQHVGFWKTFSPQDDIPILQAIALAETNDPAVILDQGRMLSIVEEYANGGIDLVNTYNRGDLKTTIQALAGLVVESAKANGKR